MLATLLLPNSTKKGTPFELTTMPYGFDRGVAAIVDQASGDDDRDAFERARSLVTGLIGQLDATAA